MGSSSCIPMLVMYHDGRIEPIHAKYIAKLCMEVATQRRQVLSRTSKREVGSFVEFARPTRRYFTSIAAVGLSSGVSLKCIPCIRFSI